MHFGPVPVDTATGAILAHSMAIGGQRLRKGQVLGAPDIAALREGGVKTVTVARLGPQDVAEDAAAARLARALTHCDAGLTLSPAFTGRVNVNAAALGVLGVDVGAVHALNLIDPAITLATLHPFQRVTPGLLTGTVKIIAYGVDSANLDAACDAARGALRLHRVMRKTAGLILTSVPGQDPKLNAKARRVIAARLDGLGLHLAEVIDVAHETDAIATALRALRGDIALILTGSATSDLHDTAPEGLRRAGGQVARFGMPVDPGNLLFLGRMPDARPVIGLPGCARSPALNGADWVLDRIACGLNVSADDIAAMGVGGLLKEPPDRPHPRERRPAGAAPTPDQR